jgi:DNA-directed RNA polymerase specialized sigma24 family protein
MNDTRNGGPRDADLDGAVAAAASGDVKGALTALYASGYLDGLYRYLTAKWRKARGEDVESAIATAVAAYFTKVSEGIPVPRIAAYILKAADNQMSKNNRRGKHEVLAPDGEIEALSDARGHHVLPQDAEQEADTDRQREQARDMALAKARELLPRLGQENVQRAMSLVLEAVERGNTDLPIAAVADTLGLSYDTAKKCLQRGFARLSRLAREAGIELPSLDDISEDESDE